MDKLIVAILFIAFLVIIGPLIGIWVINTLDQLDQEPVHESARTAII